MIIGHIRDILEAEILTGNELLDIEIHAACGSDLMSDVLAFVKDQGMLLTGLVNPQVVRTAEMMDMRCVVFVRGKRPGQDIIELAESSGIALMTTTLRMFGACGRLYQEGMGGSR